MRRIILGVDPGSLITGFGVIEIVKQQSIYLTSGSIKIPAALEPAQRLHRIYQGLQQIIERYDPTEAAIEQVFMHQNPASALKLGQARGAAMLTIILQGIEQISEYSARQIKQAVVGYGAAGKVQVQHMVKTLLNLSAAPATDAADALAVALCHMHTQQSLSRLNKAK